MRACSDDAGQFALYVKVQILDRAVVPRVPQPVAVQSIQPAQDSPRLVEFDDPLFQQHQAVRVVNIQQVIEEVLLAVSEKMIENGFSVNRGGKLRCGLFSFHLKGSSAKTHGAYAESFRSLRASSRSW
jgi:hypothetical protein